MEHYNNNNQHVSEYEYGLPKSTGGGIDSTQAGGGPYVMPPPPMGYPVRDSQQPDAESIGQPTKTRSRGDGFWKGCCAALCCCCAIDICF